MNRDETVALFLQGREAWNAWAETMLAESKALKEAGGWKTRRENSWKSEKGETPETQAWLEKACADFSHCHFLIRGAEGTGKTAKEPEGGDEAVSAKNGPLIKLIELDGTAIDFRGFVFPGYASFESAAFSGIAGFQSTTFCGVAWFQSATFSGHASFRGATFSGSARFDSVSFESITRYEGASFSESARFDSSAFGWTTLLKTLNSVARPISKPLKLSGASI